MPTVTATLTAAPMETSVRAAVIPWHLVLGVLGATCIPLGALWDISWHESIGRDTFWTPAHIVIYMGGVVPGLTCGWLALRTTFFGMEGQRAAAVRFWGARAPLGAWISIWGCFGMLTSAPFDDWWHNTYGLDVQILSPPHALLAIGMFSVVLGVLLLVLSWHNQTGAMQRGRDVRGGSLHDVLRAADLDSAALRRAADARAHLQPGHAHGAAAVPGVARGAGGGD